MQQPTGHIGTLLPEKKATIIGAGITGLMVGYYLKRSGYEVTLYESEKQVGGKIGTKQGEYGLAETAANAIFTNDDLIELLEELNIDFIKSRPKLKRMVWRQNKPLNPPISLWEIIKILFHLPRKIRTENLAKQSISEFFTPLFGKIFVREVLSAGLSGIYAESADKLHFKSLFKHEFSAKTYWQFFRHLFALRKKRKTKSESISFLGGMQTFINSLREKLNGNIKVGHPGTFLEHQNCIICTDAHEAADLLEKSYPDIARELRKITYNHLYTTTAILKREIPFLKGAFGVLYNPDLNFHGLGCLHNTAIFEGRVKNPAQQFSYTFMMKNVDDPAAALKEDYQKLIHRDLEEDLLEKITTSWKRGIPVYNYQRYESILKIRSLMVDTPQGLVILGNYVDGISIREITSLAKNLAG